MFVTVGNAKIYATSFGSTSSPVIVGIGGWIGSWELWAEPFAILSQNWRTIAYDHRGAGATLAPVESITFDRLVDDVFAMLDAYSVEHCVLAAESAGALTALGAALQKPHRITGLVIVDGLHYRETPPEKDLFLLGLRQAYPATLDRFVEACVPEPDSGHINAGAAKSLSALPKRLPLPYISLPARLICVTTCTASPNPRLFSTAKRMPWCRLKKRAGLLTRSRTQN